MGPRHDGTVAVAARPGEQGDSANTARDRVTADRRRRVLHVVTSLDFGGVERHMENLAGVLSSASMEHHFCAIAHGGAAETALRSLAARVVCLNEPPSIPSFRAIRSLVALIRHLRPNVVHCHGAEANFHGLLAAFVAGVPLRIGEEIGIPRHSPLAKWVFRAVYLTAHRVIGVADAVCEWLVDSGEVPRSKLVRVYSPVRLPPHRPGAARSGGPFRIAFVGRLERVKNPLAIVDAAHALLGSGVSVEAWFIGDGSQRPLLEARAAELGLPPGAVRLLGYQKDPFTLLRDCDVFVQPSLSEGFSLALIEAMGLGLPVIATAVGGAPEVIEDGVNGWLLPGSSGTDLTVAIEKAIRRSAAGLHEIGRAGASSVAERFSPESYVSRLESLYHEALALEGGAR
jgi:glycosyltransferase involved in cell wall biosynthesis